MFAPVVDSNYVNVYGLDITERKQAEEERRRLQERMQESQRLESLGVLAGGIAHDFNNLLMIVLGNADLALRDLSPVSPARDRLIEIEHGARRAADLCRQLLGYSGRGRFVIEPIDLSELVEEMAHMLEMSISKRAVLRYDLSKGLPAVVADATQMRQIVMNLIINASEAIGERSGVISIATGAMECDRRYLSGTYLGEDLPEGRYVYMEVSDTGCGMTKDVRERLFEPYFTTKATGRGLGLAAVLGIVRGHKGAIKIYSEEGKGTTMKVLLPVSDVPALARQQGAGTEPEEWTGSGTVLLVDDEETVRAVAGQMIERAGFDVITAQGGREAVEIYRERRDEITCVVLDLTMPHMSGEECFRELRRMDKDVRVILSSGYTEQDATERFAGKGLAGFIQKPYELAQLKDKLRECLGG
jgi:signal transduction histidine kinase/CheY-like chemotaxis protein